MLWGSLDRVDSMLSVCYQRRGTECVCRGEGCVCVWWGEGVCVCCGGGREWVCFHLLFFIIILVVFCDFFCMCFVWFCVFFSFVSGRFVGRRVKFYQCLSFFLFHFFSFVYSVSFYISVLLFINSYLSSFPSFSYLFFLSLFFYSFTFCFISLLFFFSNIP